MVCSFMVGFSFDDIRTRRNRISTTRFLNFGVIFSPVGEFYAGTNRPEPAPAGRMLCRLSCTVSCIFPGRHCFSPQRGALNFYLYPRGFVGGCAGNPRGVAKMGGTKRPVLPLREHRRHWGHKTRNALGLERGAWVRLPPSPPENEFCYSKMQARFFFLYFLKLDTCFWKVWGGRRCIPK